MSRTRHWALIALAAAGCGVAANEQTVPLETSNGITRNGITRNGITRNGITRNGLMTAPNGRLSDKDVDSDDPEATAEFLTYLVQCALPAGESTTIKINGDAHVFAGEIGLAPEWRDGRCEETCQEWITACLLARTNAYGEEVEMSVRGPHPALATSFGERLRFSMQEGAFYGNLFTAAPALYACMGAAFDSLGIGDAALRLQRRVCAAGDDDCQFEVVGPCKNFLLPPWALTNERACEGESAIDHYFTTCHADLGTPLFPFGADAYVPVVTTFVDPAHPPGWIVDDLLGP